MLGRRAHDGKSQGTSPIQEGGDGRKLDGRAVRGVDQHYPEKLECACLFIVLSISIDYYAATE